MTEWKDFDPDKVDVQVGMRIRLRDSTEFLIGDVNDKGGSCSCCAEAYFDWDPEYPSPSDVVKYKDAEV